jgi:hypothetical protein
MFPGLTMGEDSRVPNDQSKKIATDSLDPGLEAISKSNRSQDTSLYSEVDVPTTTLSAAIAWDWQRYIESTHDQFCEQCRQWFAGWEDKLARMTVHEHSRSSKAIAHHLSKKSLWNALEFRCPFCLLIYNKHSRYNPGLGLQDMREETEIPFTTMSIEETVQQKRDKCVDVYVNSPGKNSLDSINVHFTFWEGNSAYSGQCLVPGFFCTCPTVRT